MDIGVFFGIRKDKMKDFLTQYLQEENEHDILDKCMSVWEDILGYDITLEINEFQECVTKFSEKIMEISNRLELEAYTYTGHTENYDDVICAMASLIFSQTVFVHVINQDIW